MNGITIFNHSARQVLGNLGMAIRMSWWLVAIVLIFSFGVVFWLLNSAEVNLQGFDVQQWQSFSDLPYSSGQVAMAALGGIVFLIFVLWSASVIAIAWHKYILTEELPTGIIPYKRNFRVGRYFWVGVGISLLILLVTSILGGILLMIFGPSMAASLETGGGAIIGLIIALVTGIVVSVIYLRMALVLPAIALDDRLTIGDAWEASSGQAAAIAMVAVMLTVLNIVVGIILKILAEMGLPQPMISLLDLGFNWFYFMLNISILSTLYGHLVQKRDVY